MAYVPDVDGSGYLTDVEKLRKYSFEMGPIRPPSEGGSLSLLLRVTRNCPWNKCAFCSTYKQERFELRSVEEVKADIDSVQALNNEIKALSWKLGFAGRVEPLASVIQNNLYSGKDIGNLAKDELSNLYSVVNVFNWLCSGGKTAFLQDADTPIWYTNQLVEVLNYLKETFPSLERVTSYARSKTISKKKPEELKQLYESGLSRLHIGLETGDDELLSLINKGVTAEGHILGGRKAIEAGFELSEYVMPGLGGKSRLVQNAKNTARVLNEINPHYIRMRPYHPGKNTPLFEAHQSGEIELTSPHERLQEIGLMIENLRVTSKVCFDHNMNPSFWSGNRLIPLFKQDHEGYKFPEEKETVLELVQKGLQLDEAIFVDVRDRADISQL